MTFLRMADPEVESHFQSHWAASVPGVFCGKGHRANMGRVWNSSSVFGVLAPSGPPAPGLWGLGGVQDRGCVSRLDSGVEEWKQRAREYVGYFSRGEQMLGVHLEKACCSSCTSFRASQRSHEASNAQRFESCWIR
eukprot:1161762-Pelagomonas_calceolata.AAC.8